MRCTDLKANRTVREPIELSLSPMGIGPKLLPLLIFPFFVEQRFKIKQIFLFNFQVLSKSKEGRFFLLKEQSYRLTRNYFIFGPDDPNKFCFFRYVFVVSFKLTFQIVAIFVNNDINKTCELYFEKFNNYNWLSNTKNIHYCFFKRILLFKA